jgi:hypothetical protein
MAPLRFEAERLAAELRRPDKSGKQSSWFLPSKSARSRSPQSGVSSSGGLGGNGGNAIIFFDAGQAPHILV